MPDASSSFDGPATDGWLGLFWTAFNQSSNAMLVTRPDLTIAAANRAFCTAFGYTTEDLVGRRVDDFVTPRYAGQWADEQAALRRTGSITGTHTWRTADGRSVDVNFAAHVETVTGERLVLCVVLAEHVCFVRWRPVEGDGIEPLTPRERQVVARVALGRRAHEIADELYLAPTTVRTHLRNAMTKVGARSQAQLVAITLATGMIDPQLILDDVARTERSTVERHS